MQRFCEPLAVQQAGRAALKNGRQRLDYGVGKVLAKPGDEDGEGAVERSGGSGRPRVSAAALTRALV